MKDQRPSDFVPPMSTLPDSSQKKRFESKEAMILVVFCRKDGGVCSIAAGLCRWVGMNTEHLTFVARPGGKIPNKNTNSIQRGKN